MTTEHTPGPWVANDCAIKANDCYGPWIADTDMMTAHPPHKQHVSHIEQRANARLIAAAPDLLDELKVAAEIIAQYKAYAERMRAELGRGFYPELYEGDCNDYEQSARAAIAKAEAQ